MTPGIRVSLAVDATDTDGPDPVMAWSEVLTLTLPPGWGLRDAADLTSELQARMHLLLTRSQDD